MRNRFKIWKFSKSRTEAFSDGVFAIIITLLILEIKLPHLGNCSNSSELLAELISLSPKIISWAVSFFFIAVMWVQHHNVFRMADKIDYGTVWVNNVLLFFVCFLPFPTALMGEYPNNRLAVLIFGLIGTLASFMQVFLYAYVAKNNLHEHYNRKSVYKNVKRSFVLAPFLMVIAIGVSFISTWLPYLIYGLVPLFFLLPFDEDPE
jgi:uncharacterized membrane protein